MDIEAAMPVSSTEANLLRLQIAMLAHESFMQAAAALATELGDALRCGRVTVGWIRGGGCTVVARSHGAEVDGRQPVIQKIAAAMDEALEQAASVVIPEHPDGSPQLAIAHAELAANGNAACTVLIAERGRVRGALTLERAAEPFTLAEVKFCEDVGALAALILALKHRAERGWISVARDAVRRRVASLGLHGRVAVGAISLLALLALLVPVPYHVTAPARLEASVQRVIAAPLDGFLEQINVRPGDTVKAGQVLAELGTQDLQAERLKRRSELAQHENVFKAALARADRTQLVVNQARAAEAQAQLALVENQLQRSQLRAPFDGVVIKGDLAQQLGAPVQRGEALLTLAPDSRYRLIVEVDERDIGFVESAMRGKLALAAAPDAVLEFQVVRLSPVAATSEGRNFFEVEGALHAPSMSLRPGLRGVAKIEAGRRPVAWIYSHRVIDWLRLAIWSLGA